MNIAKNNSIQLILKLVGGSCNLSCKYCYEKEKGKIDNTVLEPQLVENLLNKLGNKKISIQLHGGEPLLMSKRYMSEIFRIIKKYENIIDVSIQTNGVLLDEDWIKFLKTNYPQIKIGISLDGDKKSNIFRVDNQGNESFEKVIKSLKICSKYNINVGIISVVTPNSIGREKSILEFFSQYKCIKMINFSPCFDYLSKNYKNLSISPEKYSSFIIKIYEIWKEQQYYNKFLIDPIFSIILRIKNKNAVLCHFNENKCNHMLTLYPNGLLTNCDELEIDRKNYNNISVNNIEDILKELNNSLVIDKLSKQLNVCHKCNYYSYCVGGCLSQRLKYDCSEYCNSRKKLIDHILTSINDEAKRMV